ncbi:hypothetical protein Hanom_Chr11g01030881 [Helianthus anomalus]
MLSGRAKGVKDFYATKKATYNPTAQELKSIKSEKTWMDVEGLRRSFQVGNCKAGIGILIGKMVM